MMTPGGPLPPDDENMCRVVGSCSLSTRHKSSIADPSVTSPPSVLPLPSPSPSAFIPLFPDTYLLPSIYPLFFLSRPPQLSTSSQHPSLHPPIRNKFFSVSFFSSVVCPISCLLFLHIFATTDSLPPDHHHHHTHTLLFADSWEGKERQMASQTVNGFVMRELGCVGRVDAGVEREGISMGEW